MRLVLQRVISGQVTVQGQVVGSIGYGLVVLCGIERTDQKKDLEWACNKILNTRLWPTGEKAWNESCVMRNYEVLIVSQFTLQAFLKGNKPDFHKALNNEEAKVMFNSLVEMLKKKYQPDKIQTGAFGEYMNVTIVNDGPVTIILESEGKNVKNKKQTENEEVQQQQQQQGEEEAKIEIS